MIELLENKNLQAALSYISAAEALVESNSADEIRDLLTVLMDGTRPNAMNPNNVYNMAELLISRGIGLLSPQIASDRVAMQTIRDHMMSKYPEFFRFMNGEAGIQSTNICTSKIYNGFTRDFVSIQTDCELEQFAMVNPSGRGFDYDHELVASASRGYEEIFDMLRGVEAAHIMYRDIWFIYSQNGELQNRDTLDNPHAVSKGRHIRVKKGHVTAGDELIHVNINRRSFGRTGSMSMIAYRVVNRP